MSVIKVISSKNISIFFYIIFLLILFSYSYSCSHLVYHPTSIEYYSPTNFGLAYNDIFFHSKDNVKLHGQIITSTKTTSASTATATVQQPSNNKDNNNKNYKGTILFFHGNAENLSSHFAQFIFIVNEGYDLVVFDYRGYGKSEGIPDQLGLYLDSLAALDMAYYHHQDRLRELRELRKLKEFKEEFKNKPPLFVVYGQSLGGIVAMKGIMNFNQTKRNNIDLIVMDSTFSSYQDISCDILQRSFLTYIFSPLAYLLVSDLTEIKSSLPKVNRPVLVIHGTNDSVIPIKFGKEIYDLINPRVDKWFWIVEKGRHIETFFVGNKIYQKKFLEFLNKIRSSNLSTITASAAAATISVTTISVTK
ncbi:MAG: alpha/beta hydrolase [Oligoflexia bacterium]|nr:alpha/beta hydrolase [Oligoflexia bacterium]